MKNRKNIKHTFKHRVIKQIFLGLVLLVTVFIFVAHADMAVTQDTLVKTTSYIKEQCNRYTRIKLAAETKSLMRIIESSKQIGYQIKEEGGHCSKEALKQYTRHNYVSGILILDEDGKILSQYHEEKKAPKVIYEAIDSVALLDVFNYPEKRYAVRLEEEDGSEVDVAATAREDGNGIIVAYYHTPLEYLDSFNLSIASLLSGYNLNNSTIVVVSKGERIVASNDESLAGLSTNNIPILKKIKDTSVSSQLTHTNQQGSSISQYFGLMERGRDFYVYSYLPESSVFVNTPRILLYAVIIYVVVLAIIFSVRWKVSQQYREEQLEAQKEYTEKLKNKNEQLCVAINQADKANAAKSNFLSRMSHDIRTPLNGIIGLLEISETHFDDAKLVKSNQKKMRVAANHLLSLINDILQMSKLESGEIIIAHEPLSLGKLSLDILTIIEQKAAESGITMKYGRRSDSIKVNWVYGSELHLRQIFLNIYTNCIKYNKVGGEIFTNVECVNVDEKEVVYRWRIKDTGIGMSKEFLEHIFDPFSQERADQRSVYQGTGLGMAIVKNLIEKMNGSIQIESEEGKGSLFIITLPFEIAKEPEKVSCEHTNEVVNLENLNLLLVEDNELNAEIAQMLLEDMGINIVTVGNGKQALNEFKENKEGTFDIILMDMMMPVMDGLTATKKIRALDRPDAKTIPIIAMTANAFEEDAKKCLQAGMNAHLAKPLEIEKLVETISAFCKKD